MIANTGGGPTHAWRLGVAWIWRRDGPAVYLTGQDARRGARIGTGRGIRSETIMAIFLKYGDIKGETTQVTHKGWIELSSFQFGVGRGISSGVGGGGKRESSAPSVSEISVTKTLDVSSTLLLKHALGEPAVIAKIEVTQTDNNGKHVSYQKYELTNTLISGYSISSGGERPSESFSLNFTKFDSEYLTIDDKFASKGAGHIVYDIAAAERK